MNARILFLTLPMFVLACRHTQQGSRPSTSASHADCLGKVQASANPEQYYEGIQRHDGNSEALRQFLNAKIRRCHIRLSYEKITEYLKFTDAAAPGVDDRVVMLYGETTLSALYNESQIAATIQAIDSGKGNSKQTNILTDSIDVLRKIKDTELWNREHVWPKSRGFPRPGQYAFTDLHNLRPAIKQINSDRGHYEFGLRNRMDTYTNKALCSDCKISRELKIFFPGHKSKGDIARMIFYMDLRYEGEPEDDEVSSVTPDLRTELEIQGDEKEDPTNCPSNTKCLEPVFGNLCTLLQWHLEDPPNAFEIERNNRILSLQGNRNPFIDLSKSILSKDLALQLYGKACGLL